MRVIVYPADRGGCGCYRLIWPAQALIADGRDCVIVADGDPGQLEAKFVDDPDPRVVDVVPPDADVVVLQRPLAKFMPDAITALQSHGIAVVVEIDDNFNAIHPRNTAWAPAHPRHSPDRNFHHLTEAARRADLVTVSTPALAQTYGGHGRVKVVRNCVPASYLEVFAPPHSGVRVGWTGSIQTHPDDLEETRGAVGRILREQEATFTVVGTGNGVRARLGLPEEPHAFGWVPIEHYPYAMSQIDVGIVPLADSLFNRSKSWLKMAEFAALNVPVIGSATPENVKLQRRGIGLVAAKPREWERHLRALVRSSAMRAELAMQGRQAMRELTIEANAWRWWEAWQEALANRRGRTAA